MTLLENFTEISSRWRGVFPQRRSQRRSAPGTGFAGLSGTPHPDAHHLDQGRLPAQLERRVFPAFATIAVRRGYMRLRESARRAAKSARFSRHVARRSA